MYVEQYGDRAGEVDALPPDVLQQRIRVAIQECITEPVEWDRLHAQEEAEQESLDLVVGSWGKALRAVGGST